GDRRCRGNSGPVGSVRGRRLGQQRAERRAAMRALLDIATIVLVSGGAIFFLAGTVGLLRFPDPLTRLHALTKADNLGLGLIVIGLLLQAAGILAGLKLVAVWLLAQLAGATATRLVSRSLRRPS